MLVVSAWTLPGWSQQLGFGGPAILSDPGTPMGGLGGTPLSFRPFFGVSGIYQSYGRTFSGTDPASLQSGDDFGGQARWGVYGLRQGARSLVGLDYSGNYRRRTSTAFRNGHDHFATLNFVQQLSDRTQFYLSPSASSYEFGLSGQRSPLLQDPLPAFNDPTAEAFDARTTSVAARGGLSHMVSPRTSIGLSGTGFYVGRQQSQLLDSQGAAAGASVRRMLGPNKSIGGSYQYLYFFFPNGFGESKIHSASVDYAHNLSEFWTLNLYAGGYRIYNERLQSVAVDPIVAEITGQQALLQAFRGQTWRPAAGITLARRFQRGTLSFHYRKRVDPGTAFTTTSMGDSGGVVYSYTATEKVSVGFSANASRRVALTQEVGTFRTYSGGFSVNYRIWRYMHFTSRIAVGQWTVQNSAFDRTRISAHIGITFSPGDRPLALF